MEGDMCENSTPDKAEPTRQQSKRRKVGCKQKRGKSNSGVHVTQIRTRRMRGCSL